MELTNCTKQLPRNEKRSLRRRLRLEEELEGVAELEAQAEELLSPQRVVRESPLYLNQGLVYHLVVVESVKAMEQGYLRQRYKVYEDS